MIHFITGIGTDIGKTHATGMLALALMQLSTTGTSPKKPVITQKLIQTGHQKNPRQKNGMLSPDILRHRNLSQMPITHADSIGLTAPYVFAAAASPHLAARLEQKTIRADRVARASHQLSACYQVVLLEGVGGIMTPLTDQMTTLDYIQTYDLPITLVVQGYLGSLNHTLLSLEAIKSRNLTLHCVLYNKHTPKNTPAFIADDNKRYIKTHLLHHFPRTAFLSLPVFEGKGTTLDSAFVTQVRQIYGI